MVRPGSDGRHVAKSRRHIGLTVRIVTPGCECAVGAESEAMLVSARNLDDPRQTRWHIGLVEGIVAPGHYAAIVLQGQAMIGPATDCDGVCDIRRRACLPTA